MINISGEVYITNLKELSPRLLGGTIYSFEKVKDKEEFKADSSYKGKWVVIIIVSVVALLFGFTLSKKEGK